MEEEEEDLMARKERRSLGGKSIGPALEAEEEVVWNENRTHPLSPHRPCGTTPSLPRSLLTLY
jgi:hypothetical protein